MTGNRPLFIQRLLSFKTWHLLSFTSSRWDVTVLYQCSRLPGTQRYSTHTHANTLAGMDGSANQPSRLQPQSSAVRFSPTTVWVTPGALQSVERISLHLHRKHCHGSHFSISLCTYIHSLINLACSNQPCKHALKVCGEHVDDKDRKLSWQNAQAWCVNDFATGKKTEGQI